MTDYRNLRPQLPRNFVPPAATESWLYGVLANSVTVFSGPAGYGKTSAIVAILQDLSERQIKSGWLRLDREDAITENLFTNLYSTVSAAIRSEETTERESVRANQAMLLQGLHAIGEEYVLVLDDVERVNDPDTLAALSKTMESAPKNIHFILASRDIQTLPLSRIKLRGDLQLIETRDLRFKPAQAKALLNECFGLSLQPGEISALAEKTEYWPAGLQMVALFLASGRSAKALLEGDNLRFDDISSYLWEEVFSDLDGETRAFLRETGFLSQLNGSLCDQVTGRSDSAIFLQSAFRANLFLSSLDGQGQTYRYHNQFAEFLSEKLRQSRTSEEIRTLHERAAQWHLEQGDHATALRYLIEAKSWKLACEVLVTCAWQVMGQGRVRMLLGWYERIPREALRRHPNLMIAWGWALILNNRYTECHKLVQSLKWDPVVTSTSEYAVLAPMALAFEDRFEDCARLLPDALQHASDAAPLATGTLENMQILLQLNRREFSAIEPLAAKAQAHFLQAGAGYGENYTYWLQIASLLSQGQLKRAHKLAQDNWQRTIEKTNEFSSASSLAGVCLANTLYQLGRTGEAKRIVIDHFEILLETGMIDNLIDAIRVVNRAYCLNGEFDSAREWLDDCAERMRVRKSERINNALSLERGYLSIREYDLGQAASPPLTPDISQAVRARSFIPISGDVESPQLHNFRLMIRTGKEDKAISTIHGAMQQARVKRQRHLLLKLETLLAQALYLSGQEKRALNRLEECARSAQEEGFTTVFREEGPVIEKMFEVLCRIMQPTVYLKRDHDLVIFLKAAMSGHASGNTIQTENSADLAALSRREQEVLEFVAAGLSNQAISDRLSISINTVKFHLKGIYTKLGTSSRTRVASIAHRGSKS